MKVQFATNYPENKKHVFKINYEFLPVLKEAAGKISISEHYVKLGAVPSFNTLPSNYTYVFLDSKIPGTCEYFCNKCYGMQGRFNMSNNLNVEAVNTVLLRENMPGVFKQIIAYCNYFTPRYFRIHANGDFLNIEEFLAWIDAAKKCPGTVFYCYTKKFEWIDAVFSSMVIPENFILNISVFDGYGEKVAKELFLKFRKNCNIFIAEENHREKFDGLKLPVIRCPAYKRTIKKDGTPGGVRLQHDPEDEYKYSCAGCGICQKAGHVASTLIHG